MELELSEYNSGDNRIRRGASGGAWREDRREVVRVPVRTLDEVLDELRLDPRDVRLAWVDIQGHEGYFLRGARSALAAGIPVVSEFWPYGILRSGMSRGDYVATTAGIFTHFYHMQGTTAEKLPVGRLDALFDVYAAPKEMCEVIFVNDGARR